MRLDWTVVVSRESRVITYGSCKQETIQLENKVATAALETSLLKYIWKIELLSRIFFLSPKASNGV